MLYPIFILLLIIFIALFFLGRSYDVYGYLVIIFFVLSVAWSFLGGYKNFTNPIYNETLLESATIPELDTKKNNSGKYDIVYTDEKSVYVDKRTFEKGNIEFIETDDELKIEVYRYIPQNTLFTSVDLFFNRKTLYKIYIPKGYTVYTQFSMK